jgi:mRNA interferase RelE/StbE
LTDGRTVRFAPTALKALSKLDKVTQKRIAMATSLLATNPFPPRSKKLVGPRDFYRIKVGDYRIIYAILDAELIVLVVALGHRRDVYRNVNG